MHAPAQVRVALETAREQGDDFDRAWVRALRFIEPPNGAAADLITDLTETRAVLRECKPHFRAAYEGRDRTSGRPADVLAFIDATESSLTSAVAHERRRLDALFGSDEDYAEAAAVASAAASLASSSSVPGTG